MSELRAELAANGERERREALEGLEERKNEEMGATRLGWERKVKGLLEEVSAIRDDPSMPTVIGLQNDPYCHSVARDFLQIHSVCAASAL